MKRFYDLVAASRREAGGWGVYLDGKIVRTPKKRPFAAPTGSLACAAAREWTDQGERITPETMPITRLISTAIDLMPERRTSAVEEVADFASAELICHLADRPAGLIAEEERCWKPWRDWAETDLGVRLAVASGMIGVDQPAETLAALRARIDGVDDWRLVGLHAAVTASGSLILGLALLDGAANADAVFDAAMVDELWQMRQWGEEADALARLERKKSDLRGAQRYLEALADR